MGGGRAGPEASFEGVGDASELHLRSALTRDRKDSGSLRKSPGLTTAGEIGAGPLSFSDAFPVALSNS